MRPKIIPRPRDVLLGGTAASYLSETVDPATSCLGAPPFSSVSVEQRHTYETTTVTLAAHARQGLNGHGGCALEVANITL